MAEHLYNCSAALWGGPELAPHITCRLAVHVCFTSSLVRLNDPHIAGISKSLKELQANLNDDLESGAFTYSSINKDEKHRLLNQVLEQHHQARTSVWVTMKATQIDTSNTAEHVENKLMDLFECTGKITTNTKAKMDWVGMQPAAWPLETVLAVRDGLVNSTIDFVSMTKDHIAALAAKHKAVCAAGGTVSGRAGCKDKGGTYVPLWESSTNLIQTPPLRQPVPPHLQDKLMAASGKNSKKTVVDSDDDESSNNKEDDNDDSSSDTETAMRPTPPTMTPDMGSMLFPMEVAPCPNHCSNSMAPSPGH
ncbi:hypothetical protein B0H14DRAFT_3433350 [Mycena olivaceomarginata]|nr:hypothetical protein B0H14DRAFT_3433350 [Mycena olivaceomarginata]